MALEEHTPPVEITLTKDGSHSLVRKDLDESYHSSFGAIQESLHIFIHAGYLPICNKQETLHLLEIGFGTGLNALLTLIASENRNRIHYTALEPFPLSTDIISKLNYPSLLPSSSVFFDDIHKSEWEKEIAITPWFSLKKNCVKAEDSTFPSAHFDLIYFDAFSPQHAPNLWTEELFAKMFSCLKPNGILVTYCCKGDVKRALKKEGFQIEKVPGPEGKREFIRAQKR